MFEARIRIRVFDVSFHALTLHRQPIRLIKSEACD
jgi:hypothetical protein